MQGLLFTQLTIEQLKTELSSTVIEQIKHYLSDVLQTPKQDELLTRKQAALVLGVSLPTLGEWTKEGIVKGYRINSRVRYKRNELNDALIQVKSVRHR